MVEVVAGVGEVVWVVIVDVIVGGVDGKVACMEGIAKGILGGFIDASGNAIMVDPLATWIKVN